MREVIVESLIDAFVYEGVHYRVIIRKEYNELMFYTEKADDFVFGEVIQSSQVLHSVKRPVALIRRIYKAFAHYIYSHKLKYFMFSVSDEKLKHIYERFLRGVEGYTFSEADNKFYVSRKH